MARGDTLEILIREHGLAFARIGGILVQVRARELRLADVERMSSLAHLVRAQVVGGKIAFLGVLEADAEVPEGDVRAAQTAQMKEFIADPRVHLCGIILGSGPKATMMRAIMRLVALGQTRMATTSTVREAATWLVSRGLGESTSTLMALVEEVRALAREGEEAPPPSSRR